MEEFKFLAKLTFGEVGINFQKFAQPNSKIYVLINEYLSPHPGIWEFEPFKNNYRKILDFAAYNKDQNDNIRFTQIGEFLFQNQELITVQKPLPFKCLQMLLK